MLRVTNISGFTGQRPSSGPAFSPSDISGLLLWLKADAIVGLSDGDPVSTWEDSGPIGNDFSEALTIRPTYKTNILNGLPAVRFDGVNDRLLKSGGGSIFGASAHPYSFFAVVILQGSPSAYDAVFIDGGGSDGLRVCPLISTKWGTYTGANQEAGTTLSTSTPYTLGMVASGGGGGTFYLNGASDGTWSGNCVGNSAGTDSIGAEYGVAGRECQMDVPEMIVYDSALAGGNLTKVRSYLDNKWGL